MGTAAGDSAGASVGCSDMVCLTSALHGFGSRKDAKTKQILLAFLATWREICDPPSLRLRRWAAILEEHSLFAARRFQGETADAIRPSRRDTAQQLQVLRIERGIAAIHHRD
jgi:hypothetical protein